MARIFISYRRDDTAGHAGWLYELLKQRFPTDEIFRDIVTIEYGENFVEAIKDAVEKRCHILLAVMGRQWLTASDTTGGRRLDNPHDFVRLEITQALERGIRVIPVVVQGAEVPRADQLPEGMTQLAQLNAAFLRDSSWEYDVHLLGNVIQKVIPTIGQQSSGAAVQNQENITEIRIEADRLRAELDDARRRARMLVDAWEAVLVRISPEEQEKLLAGLPYLAKALENLKPFVKLP